jgi:hypothetical protein
MFGPSSRQSSSRRPKKTGDRRRASRLALAVGALLALALAFAREPASAAPADLTNEAEFASFAGLIKAYAGASRVRWVVAAPTLAEANSALANVALHLSPSDRALAQRVRTETFADEPELAAGSRAPVGWIAPQTSPPAGGVSCSWQVWVADPAAPSAGAGPGPVYVPLAPNDRAPVSAAATFRITYTGLLQSKIYALGETRPGAIRDLAASPDVNIPVAAGESETILLAMSRQPTPFLEGIRAALTGSGGQRRDLGKEYALRETLLGRGRGIGANIQLVAPNMVLTKGANTASDSAPTGAKDVMESCLYALTPAAEAMR